MYAIKIRFLIAAARFEVKRKRTIEFVLIIDTIDNSDDFRNIIFLVQNAIIYKRPFINARLKTTYGFKFQPQEFPTEVSCEVTVL